MGIKGLWAEVRPVCRQSHLSSFRGQRVAVDMYVWLHRGILGSVQLNSDAAVAAFMESTSTPAGAESFVQLNTRLLQFVVSRVELLLRCGIHPVLVFDGAPIPIKKETEKERQMHRAARLAEAVQVLKDGPASNPRARQEAAQLLEKGMDITTELAHAVIQVLQERRLECIVAPYEADAQLAYLCKEGYVQAVISEDSDLIAYQCPCLIAKLDFHGNCEVLSAQDVPQCPSFQGLSHKYFLVGCILSGCDYLPNLRHIGVKKAFRLVAQATSVSSIMDTLNVKFGFPQDELSRYESKLQQAFYCFAHHLVFDPIRKEIVHFTPLPERVPFKATLLGEILTNEMAQKICGECLYDPVTRTLYRGCYQYCVREYWKQTRGGQTSLNTFNGFQGIQSPRVTIVLGSNNSDPTGDTISSPTTTTTLFSSPLQKVGVASGFCATTTTTRGSTVVRSKYFTKGRWKVEDWEDDTSSSSTTTNTNTTNSNNYYNNDHSNNNNNNNNIGGGEKSNSGISSNNQTQNTNAFEDILSETTYKDHRITPSYNPTESFPIPKDLVMASVHKSPSIMNTTQKTRTEAKEEEYVCDPSNVLSLVVPSLSKSSQITEDPSHVEVAGNKTLDTKDTKECVHVCKQCGQRHSVFEACFLRKKVLDCVTEDREEYTLGSNNSIRSIRSITTTSENNDSQLSIEAKFATKRAREIVVNPTLFQPVFRPPASTEKGTTSSIISNREETTFSTTGKRKMGSTTLALRKHNQIPFAAVNYNIDGVIDGDEFKDNATTSQVKDATERTGLAAKLFEKLAFARK